MRCRLACRCTSELQRVVPAGVGVAAQRHAVGGGEQAALGAAPLQRQRDAVGQLHVQVERGLPLRLVLHVLAALYTKKCILQFYY